MEHWNNIINSVLLGTAKKPADKQGLTGPLEQAADAILGNPALDREDQFLHLASVIYNYRQCGTQAITASVPPTPVATPETKRYCTPSAVRVLQSVLETDSIQLVQLWLEYCTSTNLLLPPAQLPVMLDKAWKNKSLRVLTAAAGGYRAEWLGQFNPDWNFSRVADTIEERWQNGATAQRVEALKELRIANPVLARTWLQQSWAKESATVKTELLGVLEHPIDPDDVPWLESLSGEKSKQVKEAWIHLLKKQPSSSLQAQYWQVVSAAVQLHPDGTVEVVAPVIKDDIIFQSGIEKLSNNKKISDDWHILLQLIGLIPPAQWEIHFGKTTAEVMQLFQQQAALQIFIPSLVQAIVWFEDRQRAMTFIQHSEVFYIDLIPLLPVEQQQLLSEKYFDEQPETIIKYAAGSPEEWSMPLCTRIMRYAATQPYTYNQLFMNNVVRQIPVAIAGKLDDINATETYHTGYWNNIKAHLARLLHAKSLINTLNNNA
ncbi:hypothetical protein FHW36_11068 [Chitinophaga polysaccharea]|uniref:Uncharacterized protein n=1 Tax=Chitinophaga polysaccharea TaxID=1293035 RepID=A0A561P9W9_9BACT|nr:DUF5691 domain-containing protein [Chitinophaga polysaccharea]TWF34870.1 hypothetical protein FHW36_11068 [Chitinophaga polysaccharea]